MMFELSTALNNQVSLLSTHAFILKKPSSNLNNTHAHPSAPLDVEFAIEVLAFNNDRKFYTPAFSTRNCLSDIEHQDQQYCDAFFTKTQEECLRSSLLLQPKPTSNFCFVCKEHFADYFKHINHPVHKKFLAASPCEDSIHQLIENEQKKRKSPAGGFRQSVEIPRKARKFEQLASTSSLSLHYLKELSTCVTSCQSLKMKCRK